MSRALVVIQLLLNEMLAVPNGNGRTRTPNQLLAALGAYKHNHTQAAVSTPPKEAVLPDA